jgi:hypothetical protein
MSNRSRHDAGADVPSVRTRALLAALGAPSEPGPLPGEDGALAAFRAAHRPRRSRVQSRSTAVKALLASGATAGLVLTGGMAAAASGTLPGAAQDTARQMLETVGITVPGANDASAGHADTRGSSALRLAEPAVMPVSDKQVLEESESGQGAAVSELARTTEATGVDKGAEISTLASGGMSQAGQHGSATAPETPARPQDAGRPDDGGRPSDTGTPPMTGDDAAANADEPSGGRSTDGQSHRP